MKNEAQKETTEKTAQFVAVATPYAAFLCVCPTIQNEKAPEWSDAASIRPVTVTALCRETQQAKITARMGDYLDTRTVPFAWLASTPAAALSKIEQFLPSLIARAPKTALAVTTATGEG